MIHTYNSSSKKINLSNSKSFNYGVQENYKFYDDNDKINYINNNPLINKNKISNNIYQEKKNILINDNSNTFDENYFVKLNVKLNINADPFTESNKII